MMPLDSFFLDWMVWKAFILLTHFKTVNSLRKLLLGQGAQAELWVNNCKKPATLSCIVYIQIDCINFWAEV